MNLAKIDPKLVPAERSCRVVVETPKGSRSKYTYESELEALELSGLLPAGMSFPLDFGFVPGTLAEDGDAFDILVLGDEPAVAASSIMSPCSSSTSTILKADHSGYWSFGGPSAPSNWLKTR